jgi:gamma-glutamyltranspeptidase/glutathione hydrolase
MPRDSLIYHKRSTIPSTVKTLYYAWRKYGSGKVSWEECLEPAIEYAREGFKLGEFRAKVYSRYEKEMLNSPFNTSHFLNDGNTPSKGDTIKQFLLSKTLNELARSGGNEFYRGSGGNEFYRGKIARKISDDMEINGGWITFEDLVNFPDPKEYPAIKTSYRGYDIFTAPPPCGGWTLLLAINIFKELEQTKKNKTNQERVIETLRLAHQDRKLNPVNNLENYFVEIEEKLSLKYTKNILSKTLPIREEREKSGETTHFSIADSEGNLVAVTSSINAYFGAKAASSELGFLYNTYMDDFEFGDDVHPFAIGPGKMAFSSMSPTIVRKNGRNIGSSRIISAVFQVITNWLNDGKNIVSAVNKPRIHVNNSSVYVEQEEDLQIIKEKDLNLKIETVRNDLAIKGLNAYFGGIHAIAFEKGQWVGAADPRRDGVVLYEED